MVSQAVTPLDEAISQLETALDTPLVGGELPDWCDTAVTACSDVVAELEREIDESHAPLLEQIFAEDPELAPRVEQMKQTDQELLKESVVLKQQLAGMCNAAGAVEPDEVRVADRVEYTIEAGVQLINAIRRQEVTLSTWHAESLNRDRGVAD